ncbi:hypothetical protein SLEP1_g60255, partial [Rubroshorea leprosula]
LCDELTLVDCQVYSQTMPLTY